MKNLSLLLIICSLLVPQERYSQVQIPVASAVEFQRMAELGIAVDHFDGKIGDRISVFLSASELKELDTAGIPYSVLIHDWEQFYRDRQEKEPPFRKIAADGVPKYFRYGSMGGFLKYDEVLQQIDSMKLLFPTLITAKDSIGSTIEGRTIFAVKISDNPASNESSEPEVLYTALHHAREPQGMMTLVYYMWWLLENYGKDPEATYLVNNRQMLFIPVVNPDGYIFNQTTNPDGGGMWRKNRRDNGGTKFGVDLNRNYGPFQMWNAPNGGSSTSSTSDTYRGTSPFSEPETFAISRFLKNHSIKTVFNYHTYGNYLIYPWGYSSAESDDSLLFRQWTYDMSMNNRYSIGTDLQTVGYSTRGNSDDYFYSDSGKSRTYAMTPEVGTTGFWPEMSLIYPLAEENILQNKLLAHYAGSYLAVKSFTVKPDNITLRLINKGLAELQNSVLYLSSKKGTVTPVVQTGTMTPFTEKVLDFNYSVLVPDGPTVESVKIFFKDSTGGLLNDSITFIVGTPVVLLNDSAHSTAQWSTGSAWGIVNDGIHQNSSFTDSPNGNYAANSDNSLTLLSTIDLTGYHFAELKFQTKWAIESTWDFGTVEISTDNGSSWTTLRTNLTRKGSGRSGSKQPSMSYGYDAFTPGLSWIEQTADISSYVGNQVKIRFRLSADNVRQRDGWYVDDIRVLAYHSTTNSVKSEMFPYSFSLSQNFPNPFNPSTTIRFSLREQGQTVLQVYNTLGKEVAVLIHQHLQAGNYTINFDAKQLSSGVYFYRFTSGNYTDIKKMTVVK